MINYNDGTTVHSTNLERARTDVRTSGILAAAAAEVVLALNGESTAIIDIRGTFSLSMVIEGTTDGVNWEILPAFTSSETFANIIFSPGSFRVNVAGYRSVRCRCVGFTSGSATISISASLANFMIYSKSIPTNISLTATAAISTLLLLGITSAGSGLFHYITRIRISKYCGAVLTPSATPSIVTTTNINGAPSFDFKTVGVQGDIEVLDFDFTGNPLKSLVPGTQTNISCPALTGVIWKINVFYYTGF